MRCRFSPWLALDVVLYMTCLSVALVLGRSIIAPRLDHVSCTNLSLRFAYGSDTISLALVLVSCALLPAPVILLTEMLVLNTTSSTSSQEPRFDKREIRGSRSRLKEAMYNTTCLFWDLLAGMVMAYLVLEVLKVGTAQPRPNFWDTCGNDTHLSLCGNTNLARVDLASDCTNPHHLSWARLADAAKSFPSGHSCFAAFIALFMTAYYHRRLPPSQARLPPDGDRDLSVSPSASECCGWSAVARRWLPLPWIAWATVVSASRIWDNKHHLQDVLGGVILGTVMAMYTIVVITQNFRVVMKEYNQKRTELELNTYRAVSPD